MKSIKLKAATLLLTTLGAPLAFAHEGAHQSATWFAGLLHPLTGADHLLAMLLMGAAAALLNSAQAGKLLAAIAICFVAGFAASLQLASTSLLEPVLMASVILMPLVAMTLVKKGVLQTLSLTLIAAFGASHGMVLGGEAVGSVVLFGAGATVTSLSLCGLGYGALKALKALSSRRAQATTH